MRNSLDRVLLIGLLESHWSKLLDNDQISEEDYEFRMDEVDKMSPLELAAKCRHYDILDTNSSTRT